MRISTTLVPGHRSTGDVSVTVSGGSASDISNGAFARALCDTIERSGTFAKVSLAWAQTIPGEQTAHFSDSVLAATRLRLAEEGAAKANIEQALTQIAALNLP